MKLSIFIILIPTQDFPHIYYMLGGNLGSLLYGDVSVMYPRFHHSCRCFLSQTARDKAHFITDNVTFRRIINHTG